MYKWANGGLGCLKYIGTKKKETLLPHAIRKHQTQAHPSWWCGGS